MAAIPTADPLQVKLTSRHHHEIKQFLKVLRKDQWISLGTALGLDYINLRSKEAENLLGDLISGWLNMEDHVKEVSGTPCWASLIKALEDEGHHAIVFKIKEIKVSSPQGPPDDDNTGDSCSPLPNSTRGHVTGEMRNKTNVGEKGKKCAKRTLPDDEDNYNRARKAVRYQHLKNLENLTKEEKDFFIGQLELESNKIRGKFASLALKTCDSLTIRNTQVDRVKFFLLNNLGLNLSECTTIIEVFSKTTPYWSFFNYDIIESLIDNFGDSDDKTRLNAYKSEFEEYCRHRLCEVPTNALKSDGKALAGVCVKTDKTFDVPLKDIKLITAKLSQLLNITLILRDIKEGCVELELDCFKEKNRLILQSKNYAGTFTQLGITKIYNDKKVYFEQKIAVDEKIQHKEFPSEGMLQLVHLRSPKLPDVIDSTVAADSLREHTATLVKAFRHCLPSLADSLYSQSIIPKDAHRKAQGESLNEDERSRALVSCVEARLEIQPSDFKKFVDILKSEPFFGTLGSELVQSYCTLSSIPTTKCPATISPAISQYAAYLKGVYRNSPISPDSKWPPTPSKKYINLATVEHGFECRDEFIGHTLRGNIKEVLESRKEISIDEILVPNEEGVAYLKLVVIEGAPGIGKSTLAWELCRRWEQGNMEKYSLTVLLRLREKEVQEIRSIAELFYPCPSKYKDFLLDEISSSNGKGVLFILDGFDELPTTFQKEGFLVNLIRGIFLPECTVLVTSRPSATAELLRICRPQIQKRIEVLGFTLESVEEYATSIFASDPDRLQRFKAFISASDNPAINSLMYVPLNAAIIVEIYCHSKFDHLLPRTLTQVYTQLCLTILNRYLESSHPAVALVNKFKDLPCHLYQEFLKLSEVAFDGMRRQEVIFHTLPSDLVHFGFLDAVSSLYGGGSVSYNFLHLTLQEFLAAYHISQLCGDARLALLRECGRSSHWNVVWRFVAGLTEFKFFEGQLNSDLFVEKIVENEVEVKSLFVQCLYEASFKMGRSELSTMVQHYNKTPLDMYALGYCIANLTSEVSWNLTVHRGRFLEDLVSGLKTNDKISDYSNIKRLELDYGPAVLPHLEHFPLCGITDLILPYCTFTSSSHFTKLLPSMLSLKSLSIPHCSFSDSQCADKFLQQLSQTNVTSLNIEGTTNLSEYVSALQPLIDPLTGTLEELCVNVSLLHRIISLESNIQLTNTCLTKLGIYSHYIKLSHDDVDAIVWLLEHNETVEHLTVKYLIVPEDKKCLRRIVEAIHKNGIWKSITFGVKSDIRGVYVNLFFLELSQDPRITWTIL